MAQHVQVVDYCENWQSMFQEESKRIKNILKENCVEIYHIGSTSVLGLKAKPIVDIMPVVYNLQKVDELTSEFEKIGYECLGEFGISGRRYMRKGKDERTHQVHIFSVENHYDIERHLAVRDYLRTHKNIADEYGELKQKLAIKFPYDIEKYCDGKDEFVKGVEKKAVLWKKKMSSHS